MDEDMAAALEEHAGGGGGAGVAAYGVRLVKDGEDWHSHAVCERCGEEVCGG